MHQETQTCTIFLCCVLTNLVGYSLKSRGIGRLTSACLDQLKQHHPSECPGITTWLATPGCPRRHSGFRRWADQGARFRVCTTLYVISSPHRCFIFVGLHISPWRLRHHTYIWCANAVCSAEFAFDPGLPTLEASHQGVRWHVLGGNVVCCVCSWHMFCLMVRQSWFLFHQAGCCWNTIDASMVYDMTMISVWGNICVWPLLCNFSGSNRNTNMCLLVTNRSFHLLLNASMYSCCVWGE